MIMVTGANGFIGSSIVWELNNKGIHDIICVDTISNQTRPDLLQNKKFTQFLLTNEVWDFLKTSPLAKNIQWIIHMGACSSTTETNWDFLFENNTKYTEKLFTWCKENNANYIYASSAATYGAGEKGFSDVTHPDLLTPLNLYGKSKLLFDQWALHQTLTPKNWYGLKFFNVYGPNEYFKGPQASVVHKAFHEIQKTNSLQLFKSHNPNYEDGKQLRDFIYVKDITRWILELMTNKPENGIYNMGYGAAKSWLDLANGVFSALQKSIKINWIEIPENIRNQYQYFTQSDMNKWNRAGMSAPQWPLEVGIKDTVEKYLLDHKIM